MTFLLSIPKEPRPASGGSEGHPLLASWEDSKEVVSEVFYHLYREDFAAAEIASKLLPEGPAKSVAEAASIRALAATDLPAAFARAWSQDENRGQCRDLAAYWLKQNPEQALTSLAGLPKDDTRTQLLSGGMESLAMQDVSAVERWVGKLPLEDQGAAFSALVKAKASQDVPGAQQAFSQWLASGAAVQQTLLSDSATALVHGMLASGQGGEQAISWLDTLPPGETRNATLKLVVSEWAGTDPQAVSQWLTTLPAGTAKDEAVWSMTGAIATTDPERAIAWASTISEPQSRSQRLSTIFENWFRTHPDAASAAWQTMPPQLRDSFKSKP